MNIAGMQKSSTIDYPGRLAAVLFAPGCDLSCFYCHNRPLIAGSAPLLPEEEVWGFLKKRQGLLDGVVLSGGEPTLQRDLEAACRRLKDMGYGVKLDTNGQHPERVKTLLKANLIDYLAVDIKALPGDYPSVAGGGSFDAALACLGAAMDANIPCEGRTTVYPGLGENKLLVFATLLPALPRWRRKAYRMREHYVAQVERWVRTAALSELELAALLGRLRPFQPGVMV